MTGRAGIVYLVGAGPGDPGLLTVRGRDLLATCDAIASDALANPAIVAEALRANPRAEVHDVGKRGGSSESASQESINALLVSLARAGKRVVRLKGGDPLVFGRGSEEAQALAAAGVAFELVPGVTAGVAAPAYAGIPVTHRGVATAVTFVTGHEDPSKPETQTDWAALARAGGTIVLYMGVKTLPRIAGALMAGGMPPDTPAAAVQWGTHARQRTVTATVATLADAVAREALSAPVITIIGDVVSLREEIAWFDRRPLFGRRVVVTRASAQAGGLRTALAELGADVLELPALRVEPLDPAALAGAVAALSSYKWLVLTSQNAVSLLWDALRAAGLDARSVSGIRLACVGKATSEALLARGLAADVVPDRFVAEAVLEKMRARYDVKGTRVLYVAAEGAREVLPDGLRALGATVDVVRAYRSVSDGAGADSLRAALEAGTVDAVTFASASAVAGFLEAVGPELARRAPAVSIGPITSDAVRAAGIALLAESAEASVAALARTTADALTAAAQRRV
ncbi:MAG: uroporphyrinogen-III C-methyltransferase / uroporphyrinogen-III synthase [Gemmatimonadetes bacterium]|jgi:uroporphyrinogen III methyltransferase/synthase|nr:uroporphyrinogen-III C-methyltransferase / uroporphyrinogen-III synthase [Gemmatimonadota bacterium]